VSTRVDWKEWKGAFPAVVYSPPVVVTSEQLVQTLLRRQREQREQQSKRAAALRHRVEEEARALVAAGTVRRVWLIGSLAWGSFGVGSDVDLVVSGCPPERAALLWRDLSSALEIGIDLLRFEDLPADFAQRVLEEGVELR
jgi:predicted nucleotidyltransferase